MTARWTEEKIAALVDGSLEDEAEAAALRQQLESDAAARAYAEEVARSNRLIREAFDAPGGETIPARIQAALFGEADKVEMLRPRRRFGGWIPTSVAAGLALAIGLGAGLFLGDSEDDLVVALGEASSDGALHRALETLPSGAISGEGVQPMISFRDGAGRLCREFEVTGDLPDELEFGIACRTGTGRWTVEIIVAAPVTAPGPGGYAPASGPAADALDAMLDALEASPPLDPEAETSLMRRGWRDSE